MKYYSLSLSLSLAHTALFKFKTFNKAIIYDAGDKLFYICYFFSSSLSHSFLRCSVRSGSVVWNRKRNEEEKKNFFYYILGAVARKIFESGFTCTERKMNCCFYWKFLNWKSFILCAAVELLQRFFLCPKNK